MGKNLTAKTPLGDFQVTTLEIPLLSQQVVTSKGIPIPYTNPQLNPYLNTQLDLFYNDNLSFSMHALSTWLTNRCVDLSTRLNHQLEKDVGCKVSSVHHMMKFKKLIGHKTLQCTNTAASSRERWTSANSVSSHNLHEKDFASHSCNFCNLWRPSK